MLSHFENISQNYWQRFIFLTFLQTLVSYTKDKLEITFGFKTENSVGVLQMKCVFQTCPTMTQISVVVTNAQNAPAFG